MKNVDFKSEVKYIDPKRLIKETGKDRVADFFLVLGIFYNDLKSLILYMILIDNKFENIDKTKLSAELGEYGGIKSHLERLAVGTIYEFFKFVEKNVDILKTTEFELIYKKLNRENKNRWDLIIKISIEKNQGDGSNFSKILKIIRNNLSFHYYQSNKILREGFIDYFYHDKKITENENACYSIKETMQDTRFYYCDAAAQRSVISQVSKIMEYENYAKQLKETINNINYTIQGLMRQYLKQIPF